LRKKQPSKYLFRKLTSGLPVFSLISLIVIVGAAFLYSYLTSLPLKRNVIDKAIEEASNTSLRLVRHVTPDDLVKPMAGQRLRDFDSFVKENIVSAYTARIKLWNKDSTVIYSDDYSQIGQSFVDNHELSESLHGAIATEVKTPTKQENKDEKGLNTLIEIYIPLRFPGSTEVQGAFEVYESWAPFEQIIHQEQVVLFRAKLFGLIGLCIVLIGIAYYIWEQAKRKRLMVETKDREVKCATELNVKVLNEQARLLEGVEKQKERLSHLSLAMTLAQKTPGVLEMGRELLGLIQKEVGAHYSSLELIDSDGTMGQRMDISNGKLPAEGATHPGSSANSGLKLGKTLYVPDTEEDSCSSPALVASGIRSYIGLTMKLEGQLIGNIFFYSTKPDAFREDRLFLESFANICAIPLQRARLLSQVELAKEELEATFDAIPSGVALINEDKEVIRANEAFAQLVGKPIDRTIGASVCKLIHGRDERLHRCPLEASISNEKGESVAFYEPHLANVLVRVKTYTVRSSPEKPRRYVQFFTTEGQS